MRGRFERDETIRRRTAACGPSWRTTSSRGSSDATTFLPFPSAGRNSRQPLVTLPIHRQRGERCFYSRGIPTYCFFEGREAEPVVTKIAGLVKSYVLFDDVVEALPEVKLRT